MNVMLVLDIFTAESVGVILSDFGIKCVTYRRECLRG